MPNPLTTERNITLLRDTMNAALRYTTALSKAGDAREELRGFLDSCRATRAGDATVDTILSFVSAEEENHMLAPGSVEEDYRDEDRTPPYMPDLDFSEVDSRYSFAVNGMAGCGFLIPQDSGRLVGDEDFAALMGPLEADSVEAALETIRIRITTKAFNSERMDALETGWLHLSQKWAGADAS